MRDSNPSPSLLSQLGTTRWRKVARDLWLHKLRSMLVMLAMAIGLASIGIIVNAWALVNRATTEGYLASNPASATLSVDRIDAALLETVRKIPGVREAQARRTTLASIQAGGAWHTGMIFSSEDFRSAKIGAIVSQSGAWPPADGEFVIEQSSIDFSGAVVGEPVNISVASAAPVSLKIGGSARDVGLAPGWMEHIVYGFATPATLAKLGVDPTMNQLQIVADRSASRTEIRMLTAEVARAIEGAGHKVTNVDVPEPGEHIHAAQMDSLLYTQGAFGLLGLLVCCFLVVNLISAMLARQVREIGVMKTIGGSAGGIASMYIVYALTLGVLSTVLAIPIAVYGGRQYGALRAELLNFSVDGYAIPTWVIVSQILLGALLPVIAAAFPVWRASRMSVAAALRDVGIAHDGREHPLAYTGRLGLSRPTLLSLRNAFRNRQRMILTMLTLSAGGAVFLGAANLRLSVIGSLDLLFGSQQFDFALRMSESHDVDSLEHAARSVPGVKMAEAWVGTRASMLDSAGLVHSNFAITGPPAKSTLIRPQLESGHWFSEGVQSADNAEGQSSAVYELVVNRTMMNQDTALSPGRVVTLVIGGKPSRWKVVGVVASGPQPSAFASRESIMRVTGSRRGSSLMVLNQNRDVAMQLPLIQELRSVLGSAGMSVTTSQLLSENRRVTEDHLLMVVQFLGVMGWVMMIVGGMALASTMSLAVMERARELAVMRTIGATNGALLQLVQVESLVIGLVGWLIAIPLSVPISAFLAVAFSRIMLPVPIIWVPSIVATAEWLMLVVVVSAIASALPAIRAMRTPVASTLAYA